MEKYGLIATAVVVVAIILLFMASYRRDRVSEKCRQQTAEMLRDSFPLQQIRPLSTPEGKISGGGAFFFVIGGGGASGESTTTEYWKFSPKFGGRYPMIKLHQVGAHVTRDFKDVETPYLKLVPAKGACFTEDDLRLDGQKILEDRGQIEEIILVCPLKYYYGGEINPN